MLKIETIVVTPFAQNCRLLLNSQRSAAALVDPGGEVEKISAALSGSGAELRQVLLTHSHIDHAGGVSEVLKGAGSEVKLYGHRLEKSMRQSISIQSAMFMVQEEKFSNCPEPSTYLEGGEEIDVLGERAKCLFTPGHSPGHISFYFDKFSADVELIDGANSLQHSKDLPLLIVGDALFSGSIGRTDLPGGNHEQLLQSIKSELLSLPDETVVLSGHGPNTTIGVERVTNPFLV